MNIKLNKNTLKTDCEITEKIISETSKSDKLLKNLGFKKEPIRDGLKNNEGEINYEFNEILSDFGETTTTPEALNILREENKTFDLFKKMLMFAINEVNSSGTPSSINLYLKDLQSPLLIQEIEDKEKLFNIDSSKIFLEILEYNYGELNEQAIFNLIELRKKGYKFAIDDFSLEYDPEDLSFDNLAILLKYDIVPSYVKIDGKYLQKIFSKQFDDNHKRELKIIIKFLKSKGIKIIGEWIGNVEEGYMAKGLGIQLFQGKYLNNEFILDSQTGKPEVESFKLVKNSGIKSFSLYRKGKNNSEKTENDYERIALSTNIVALMTEHRENVKEIINF